MLASADQHPVQARPLRSANIVLDIIANHDSIVWLNADREQCLLKKGEIWLTQDCRALTRCQL